MILSNLEPGLSKAIQKKITEADTAMNFGSGAIKDLLATPALAALMIEAAVQLVDPLLPDNYFTIGKVLNIIGFQVHKAEVQSDSNGTSITVMRKLR